jgi:hypothetical protein
MLSRWEWSRDSQAVMLRDLSVLLMQGETRDARQTAKPRIWGSVEMGEGMEKQPLQRAAR